MPPGRTNDKTSGRNEAALPNPCPDPAAGQRLIEGGRGFERSRVGAARRRHRGCLRRRLRPDREAGRRVAPTPGTADLTNAAHALHPAHHPGDRWRHRLHRPAGHALRHELDLGGPDLPCALRRSVWTMRSSRSTARAGDAGDEGEALHRTRQRRLAWTAAISALILVVLGVVLFLEGNPTGGWTTLAASAGILSLLAAGYWLSRRR